MEPISASIDKDEIEKFSKMAESWWDEAGKFRPLHQINPIRIGYILGKVLSSQLTVARKNLTDNQQLRTDNSNLKPLQGLRLLDIGCGGGLLSEPMARLGAEVTGIDASEKNIKIAKLHAEQEELEIDYQNISVEELASEFSVVSCQLSEKGKLITGNRQLTTKFNIILNMEVIEHVAEVDSFMKAASDLLAPGGLMFIATLNRTLKSLALAKIGAEYILRWLPKGTHDWNKFLKPSEIEIHLKKNGLTLKEMKGLSYNPLKNSWFLSDDLSINYFMVARKE